MSRVPALAKSPAVGRRPFAIGAVIAVITTGLLVGCAGIPADREVLPPEVTLADIRPVGAGLLEQRYEAVLRLRNPNEFAVPLSGLRYNLELNGRPFGSGSTSKSIELPRLGETTVAVESSTNIVQLLTQLGALRQGGLEYAISGDAFISGSSDRTVPFKTGGQLF